MIIIIGPSNFDNEEYNQKFLVNKLCEIKNIEEKDNVLILKNVRINEIGLIEEYNYFLDEILITIPLNVIISNNFTPKLLEIAQFYQVPIIIM